MGLLAREGTAPIADGEPASGSEVEAEFAKLFAEVNGSLDNDNVADDAGVNGAKLATASAAGAKLEADTLTTEQMAKNTVPRAYVVQDESTDNLSLTNVHAPEGMTLSLSDVGVGDWIIVRFTGVIGTVTTSERVATISIDGVEQNDLGKVFVADPSFARPVREYTLQFDWSFQATSTTHTIVLMSRINTFSPSFSSVTASWTGAPRTFMALVFPQK